MGWHELVIGLFAFFIVLNTITIGLRVFIRTKLTKGAFGWDDIVLIFTHVSSHGQSAVTPVLKYHLDKKS